MKTACRFYGGGGFGRARVKPLGDSDSAWAWQGIAGVRYALSPQHRSRPEVSLLPDRQARLSDDRFRALAGNPEPFRYATPDRRAGHDDVTTNAVAFTRLQRSVPVAQPLASLIFNFGGAEAAAAAASAAAAAASAASGDADLPGRHGDPGDRGVPGSAAAAAAAAAGARSAAKAKATSGCVKFPGRGIPSPGFSF